MSTLKEQNEKRKEGAREYSMRDWKINPVDSEINTITCWTCGTMYNGIFHTSCPNCRKKVIESELRCPGVPQYPSVIDRKLSQAGLKLDSDKPRWDLLPIEQVEQVVKVLTFGAKKYDDDNWKKVGGAKGRYIAAAFRHIVARVKGEMRDKETGLPHTAHAICCLLFLMWFDKEEETW